MDDYDDDEGNGPMFDNEQRFEDAEEPTDLARVSSLLVTGDSYRQGDIVQGVMYPKGMVDPSTAESRFINEAPRMLSLHQLKRDFDNGNVAAALQHLGHRSKIELTEDDMHASDSQDIVWWKHDQRLDLKVSVSMYPGLTAIIPNERAHHNYNFQCTVTKPHIAWTAKYGKLGFDPARRMLFLGTVEGQQAWLAFVPKTVWQPDLTLPKKYTEDRNSKTTLMPRGRYRRAVCMMASFCDFNQIQGIMNNDEFPQHIDSSITHAWSASMNIT